VIGFLSPEGDIDILSPPGYNLCIYPGGDNYGIRGIYNQTIGPSP
jgi:hypothetical protein